MKNYEKSVKITLCELILKEARANMELDMSLKEHQMVHNAGSIAASRDDEYDETAILFSLIQYIIRKDFNNEELLSISSSTSLHAKVSSANEVIEVTFINDSIKNDAPAITLEFLE